MYRYRLIGKQFKTKCPRCGQRKRFSPYVDTLSMEPLDPELVGRCDRLYRCGYHFTPSDYFKTHPQMRTSQTHSLAKLLNRPADPDLETFSMDGRRFRSLMSDYQPSNLLTRYLLQLSHDDSWVESVHDAFHRYGAFASRFWNGAPLLPYRDIEGTVRDVKIMAFDPLTGKRVKDPHPKISWASSILAEPNKEYAPIDRPFFGEHLLRDRPAAHLLVFESEKTALIMAVALMTVYGPTAIERYVPLAVGGADGLTPTRMATLERHISRMPDMEQLRVSFHPDNGCFDKWLRKTASFRAHSPRTRVVCPLMEAPIGPYNPAEGADMADCVTFLLSGNEPPQIKAASRLLPLFFKLPLA